MRCVALAPLVWAAKAVARLPQGALLRLGAYQILLERGYKAQLVGVTMHLPDQSAYHNASAWVIDDWR